MNKPNHTIGKEITTFPWPTYQSYKKEKKNTMTNRIDKQ